MGDDPEEERINQEEAALRGRIIQTRDHPAAANSSQHEQRGYTSLELIRRLSAALEFQEARNNWTARQLTKAVDLLDTIQSKLAATERMILFVEDAFRVNNNRKQIYPAYYIW